MSVNLVTHTDGEIASFDERRVGLDHLALLVSDRSALDGWVDHLNTLGVPHSGIQDEVGGPLVVLRDPDNIQLELWAFDPALV
jgi:catechol-2,3-dioxygenase